MKPYNTLFPNSTITGIFHKRIVEFIQMPRRITLHRKHIIRVYAPKKT